MNTCKYCGKPLTLTPEYDACMECQGKIMREATMPQGGIATNSTQPNMITQDIIIMGLKTIKDNSTNKVDRVIIDDAIKIIKHDSEIVKDVKRYFELDYQEGFYNQEEYDEWYELKSKLMKVGNEDATY